MERTKILQFLIEKKSTFCVSINLVAFKMLMMKAVRHTCKVYTEVYDIKLATVQSSCGPYHTVCLDMFCVCNMELDWSLCRSCAF